MNESARKEIEALPLIFVFLDALQVRLDEQNSSFGEVLSAGRTAQSAAFTEVQSDPASEQHPHPAAYFSYI